MGDVQTCRRGRQPPPQLTTPSPRRPAQHRRLVERRTPCLCLSHCPTTINTVDTMLPLKDMSLLSVVLLVLFSVTICDAMCPARCSCHDDTLQATCADAQLEVVPIQLNPDLQQIDLRANRILDVDYTLSFYRNLKHLDVSMNRISSLGVHNFELQEYLSHLNVSHNEVTSLGKGTFKGLKSLQVLDLSHNMLESISGGAFKDTSELEILDLSYNRVTSFDDDTIFKTLTKLRVIALDGNQILDIPSALLGNLPSPSLEKLTLSDNLIEELTDQSFPPSALSNLKVITLGSNVVSNIEVSTFNPLHSLTTLDLSYNNLTFIPTQQLSKLSQLTDLDLSGNVFQEIKPVAFQSLFHLKILKISRMPYLSRIDPRAFVDNIRLESVMLDDNMEITVLPTRIFHGNHHLLHVSIQGNSLTTLDASHFPVDRLRSLDVSGNPFICNCSLLWLWKLAQEEQKLSEVVPSPVNETTRSLENNETLRINLQNLKCDRPEALHGKLLLEVPESTVRCETTWLTVAVVTALVLALFGATCVILLLIGTDKRFTTCRRSKDPGDSSAGAETRRLATSLHSNGAPPPILMLMPDKEYPMNDSLMNSYMKTRGEPQLRDLRYLEPWVPVKTIDRGLGHNDYSMDVSNMRKPPHIVYV